MNFLDHEKVRLLDDESPLQPLPRLTEHLRGPRLFIKRDDEGGPAGGGNKLRKFERQFANAIARGADVIILPAHSQSNCARELAGSAARHGLECRIVIKDIVGRYDYAYEKSGNALLMQILGTQIVEISKDRDFGEAMDEVAQDCRDKGLTPYILPFGASNPLGVVGYVESGREILSQSIKTFGHHPNVIVTATGSCGTQAGLVCAALEASSRTHVQGFSVLADAESAAVKVAQLASETLGRKVPDGCVSVDGRASGGAYGRPTPEGIEAIKLLARMEGIFLDPVYTGKAMAGLIDWLPESGLGKNDTVVFVHTGGMPLLFAYADEFQ
ncbi:MAG: D-cysteine desulfhydrase family protein [Sulfitobacter sp.]